MDLKAEIMADPRNKNYTERGIAPIYMIDTDVRILIIGQAPGLKVEQTGISFNDASGDRLRDWMGIDRNMFYNSGKIGVLPMDFYYPGKAKTGDLPPRKFVAQEWHTRILETMPKLEMIILMGTYAQRYYLPVKSSESLTSIVYRYTDFGPKYFPVVHSSPLNNIWIKKNPWFIADVVPNLKIRVAEILAK